MKDADDYGNNESDVLMLAVVIVAVVLFILWQILG
jgi:hypothetical protein